MASNIFERIVLKEVPSYTIFENDSHMAFLDIKPLSEGHTLVIPKVNLGGYIFDMEDDKYIELLKTSKVVAKILKEKLDCKRVLMLVEGYGVDYVHVHLIPSYEGDVVIEMKHKEVSEEKLKMVYEKITS